MTNESEDYANGEFREVFQTYGNVVRGHIEESLNLMLDAKEDQLCVASGHLIASIRLVEQVPKAM